MANPKYGWAGFQHDINAPGPFEFKPLTDNMYDGIEVPKYFDGKKAQWGTRTRPAQEFVDDPTPFLGIYDRVSISIAWTGEVGPDIFNPDVWRDNFRPNPCVSDMMKLSAKQREEIRTKIPLFYELMAGRNATFAIGKIRPSNVPFAQPTVYWQGGPHANGGGLPHPAQIGGQGVAGHPGHQPGQKVPLWDMHVVGANPRASYVHRPLSNVPQIAASYGGFRTTLTWTMDALPTPDNTKSLAGTVVTYAPRTAMQGLGGNVPASALHVIWDDALALGYDLRPGLTFTPEVDSSPERNAFACLTLRARYTGCVAILIFKKRGNVSTPLTAEERQSLNIGRTFAEVEAYHQARAHQYRRPI